MSLESSSLSRNNTLNRRSDRVVLDVGGKRFITSETTLTASSMYFRAKFSDEWRNNQDESLSASDDCAVCFLDQDPEPFSILLSYMRNGFVNVSDVCEKVLTQAEFLGLENLLSAVKCQAFLNIYPRHNIFSDTQSDSSQDDIFEKIITYFDEDFGGIMGAIASGILPACLAISNEDNKPVSFPSAVKSEEYASITLIRKNGMVPLISVQVDGEVQGQHYVQSYPPRHNKFLLALNWFERLNFKQVDVYENGNEAWNWRRLTFSRSCTSICLKGLSRKSVEDCVSHVLIDRNRQYFVKDLRHVSRKEFAMIAYCKHPNDDGNLPPYAVVMTDAPAQSDDQISETVRLTTCAGIDEAMNMLLKESYMEREKSIEEFYKPMLVGEGGAIALSIFSRSVN